MEENASADIPSSLFVELGDGVLSLDIIGNNPMS
jgi:hypothetical protein